jgi:hypothetical protein
LIYLSLLGLFVAFTTAMFGQSRYPYAFLLCGMTSLVVSSNGLSNPEMSWLFMIWRIQEVFIGIVAVMLVQSLLWPRYAATEFLNGLRGIFLDLRDLMQAARSGNPTNDLAFDSRLNQLRQLLHFGGRESRSDGDGLPFSPRYLRPAGPPFSLRGAPDNLTLLCGGDEDDQPDVSFGLNLDPGGDWIPGTPPTAPNSGETENYDFAYAVHQLTDLPGTPGSTVLAPIDFRTRPGVLAFEAVWSVRVSVFDPFPTPREVIPRLTPRQRLLAPGEAARVRGSDGRRRVIALSRQGVRIGTGRRDRERWTLLEGPRPLRLLLDAGPEGRLDLVLSDEDGQVHAALDGLVAEGCGQESPGAAWIPLGGPFAAPPLALRVGQGVLQLFALDDEGLLRCRPVDREPRDWRAIGGPFRGTLVGWAPQQGPLTLAAEDVDGRFWVGTMNNLTRGPEGRMFCLEARRGLVEFPSMAPGLRIPNSLAFSPDGRTMYFADSLDHAIRAFEYDPSSGLPGASRPFAHFTPPAFPDGACVDTEGGVWSARFHGGCIVRHDPDGRLSRVIELPVRRPTSCAFGGQDLSTLYVTTTCQQMSAVEREAEPLAGRLLALDVGCRGLPEPRFALHGLSIPKASPHALD